MSRPAMNAQLHYGIDGKAIGLGSRLCEVSILREVKP
jgi:hypothetical protein